MGFQLPEMGHTVYALTYSLPTASLPPHTLTRIVDPRLVVETASMTFGRFETVGIVERVPCCLYGLVILISKS